MYLYIIDLINARKMEHITKIYYFNDILHSTYISVVTYIQHRLFTVIKAVSFYHRGYFCISYDFSQQIFFPYIYLYGVVF